MIHGTNEKTAKAIGNFKPFIVIGCQDWYKYFTSFGFVLYDELFDYSFIQYGEAETGRSEKHSTVLEASAGQSTGQPGLIWSLIRPECLVPTQSTQRMTLAWATK